MSAKHLAQGHQSQRPVTDTLSSSHLGSGNELQDRDDSSTLGPFGPLQ